MVGLVGCPTLLEGIGATITLDVADGAAVGVTA
ncbi:MAG: hypothetical protein RJA35_1106, partial [Actinomycetota bacterium]